MVRTGFIAIWLALVCRWSFTADAAAPLAHYDLTSLPEKQFDNWSAVSDEAGTACRLALAGKFSHVRIKAWWNDGELRPAEGEWFVFEVKYKDVVTKPAKFYAFSGVGRNFGDYLLHRFGGTGDGQWKTAAIPVSWDLVARLVSTIDSAVNAPEMTRVAIAAESNLPVASIAVRRAVPADETRFYAECRAQIAFDQQAERAKRPMPKVAEKPGATEALVAYPWDPLCRLYPDSPVPQEQIGKPVKISMCLNQLEPGSFGVYANGAPLTGVDYEITPLLDAEGRTLKAYVKRRTAEYALFDGVWSPLRLWPAYAADVPEGCAQWFFFNVETRRGESAAGVYKGRIQIRSKNGQAELPLEVEVLPVDLLTMEEAGLTMFGCYQQTPPLHDIEFQRQYSHNAAMLWYTSFTIPTALRDGKVVVDFTYPEDWMKGIRERGFTHAVWYLGGDPYGFPRTLNVFAHLGTLNGKRSRDEWCRAQMTPQARNSVLPDTRPLFVDWMRQVNTRAVANQWPELLPTPHDEPQKWASNTIKGDKTNTIGTGPWIKPFFKDACAAIREAHSGLRIYGCIHHIKGWKGIADLWKVFIDDIDVFNTNAVQEDPEIGDKLRGAHAQSLKAGGKGKWFWQYTGTGGGVPANQRYTYGFYFGAFGSTGFGSWAYNWNEKWDISGRKGDLALMAWATAYETIPSPWLEGQRSLDDRRIIETYRKRFAGEADAISVLQSVLNESQTSRSENSGNDTVSNFFEALEDASKLGRWRATLLRRLAATSK